MDMNLGANLKTLREERNWPRQYVADHLGVHRQSVGSWERGATIPSGKHQAQLTRLFGVDVVTLRRVGIDDALLLEIYEYLEEAVSEQNKSLNNLQFAKFGLEIYRDLIEDAQVGSPANKQVVFFAAKRLSEWLRDYNETIDTKRRPSGRGSL